MLHWKRPFRTIVRKNGPAQAAHLQTIKLLIKYCGKSHREMCKNRFKVTASVNDLNFLVTVSLIPGNYREQVASMGHVVRNLRTTWPIEFGSREMDCYFGQYFAILGI